MASEASDDIDSVTPEGDWVSLTSNTIDVTKAMQFVQDNSAGAVATFAGVTRDNFQV
jgi:molybdopterin synthase catalytic subunit